MIQSILFTTFSLIMLSAIALFLYFLIKEQSKIKDKTAYTIMRQNHKKSKIITSCVLGVSLLLTIFIPGSFHQVEAGQIAVVKNLGRIVGTRYPGTYFDFYMTNSYTYFDSTVQKLEINTASYSSDAQTMEIQMTVQFKIDKSKVENILIEYSNMQSLTQRIEKVADDNAKSVLSKYTAMKIIETRAAISPEVEESIKEAVGNRYYVTITAVNLSNIDFTPEFEKAVEDKVIAEQQKEAAITKAEQELEVAKLTAQAKIETASGDAESQKIIASATAEAMTIKIVELAKSLGFEVKETYIKTIETEVIDATTNSRISLTTFEEEVNEKFEEGTILTQNEKLNQITTITTSLTGIKYSIIYDETHTKEDLSIIIDFIKYLEYLEKWNGELPKVVTGQDGINIMIPSTSAQA